MTEVIRVEVPRETIPSEFQTDQVMVVLAGPPGPMPSGAIIGLVWDGVTYQPESMLSVTSAPRVFFSKVEDHADDPATVPGYVESDKPDQWIEV